MSVTTIKNPKPHNKNNSIKGKFLALDWIVKLIKC